MTQSQPNQMFGDRFESRKSFGVVGTAPRQDESHDEVDEASEESFPASDPPAWEPTHTGPPDGEPSRAAPRRDVDPTETPPRGT